MGYSGALGKLIHGKNLRSKISWHCPFKTGKEAKQYNAHTMETKSEVFLGNYCSVKFSGKKNYKQIVLSNITGIESLLPNPSL
jgi:hypothetical protein